MALAEVLGAAAFLAFANLPWDFVYLRMTQSWKFRASVPIIPRTVNVTYACGMSNDTSVFPVALLENAVTRQIAYQGEEVCGHLSDEPRRYTFPMNLFVFDL